MSQCSICKHINLPHSKYCNQCSAKLIANVAPQRIVINIPDDSSQRKTQSARTVTLSIIGGIVALFTFVAVIYSISNSNITTDSGNYQETYSIYAEPAANFFQTGEAYWALVQTWGVALSDGNGPRSLGQVADDAYYYAVAHRNSTAAFTPNDVALTFLPGNSMHSFFSRLCATTECFEAIRERWVSNAS